MGQYNKMELKHAVVRDQQHKTELKHGVDRDQQHKTELKHGVDRDQQHKTELKHAVDRDQQHKTELKHGVDRDQQGKTELKHGVDRDQRHKMKVFVEIFSNQYPKLKLKVERFSNQYLKPKKEVERFSNQHPKPKKEAERFHNQWHNREAGEGLSLGKISLAVDFAIECAEHGGHLLVEHRDFVGFQLALEGAGQCALVKKDAGGENHEEFQHRAQDTMLGGDADAVFQDAEAHGGRLYLGGRNLVAAHVDDVARTALQMKAAHLVYSAHVGGEDLALVQDGG